MLPPPPLLLDLKYVAEVTVDVHVGNLLPLGDGLKEQSALMGLKPRFEPGSPRPQADHSATPAQNRASSLDTKGN